MAVKVRERPKGSGVWWVFIDHQGKRKAKKIGRDRKLAGKVAKKIEAKLVLDDFDLDQEGKPDVPKFGEYAQLYLNTFVKLHHKPTTVDSYRSILENHILPLFKNHRLDEISRKDIKAFIIKKQSEKLLLYHL